MKIVSAIYLRCHTVLKDDWISKSDTDSDMEDGMVCNIPLSFMDMSFIFYDILDTRNQPTDACADI